LPHLRFDIVDTGIGMTHEQIERIFRPFSQADTSTSRRFGGSGLGLTISKRLAEKLGGDIAVETSPGVGSRFSVTIETGSLEGVAMLHSSPEATIDQAESKTTKHTTELNYRLLLVEDGIDNQRLISFLLRKVGAEVTIAENGQLGFEAAMAAEAEGCPFDVILMDMQMPVLDGYSATRKLRSHGYEKPIIALTAHAMSSDREKCLAAGCDDYTTKPIHRAVLLELIACHARESRERVS